MLARLRGMSRTRCGLVACAVLLAGAVTASASWHMPGAGAGLAQASVDFHAPIVTAETIAPAGASAAGGAIAPGGQFVVYANVVDVGVSGIAWVRTNVSSVETGATSVTLSPCSSGCTIAGTTYGWSSAAQTANAGLAQGTQSFGVWSPGQRRQPRPDRQPLRDRRLDQADHIGRRGRGGDARHRGLGALRRQLRGVREGDRRRSARERHRDVTANVSTITSGQTAVALPTCTTSCTVGGVTYTYKSAPLTASSIADGTQELLGHRDRRGGELAHVELHRHGRQHRAGGHCRCRGEHRAELCRATRSRARPTSSTRTRPTRTCRR